MGATNYEAARSTAPDFSVACVLFATTGTSWVDAEPLAPGAVFYYLVRAAAPYVGSWGRDSTGVEREFPGCVAP